MLVARLDSGDNTDWRASTTNQAGTYRLPRGSYIVGAVSRPLVILLWTQAHMPVFANWCRTITPSMIQLALIRRLRVRSSIAAAVAA